MTTSELSVEIWDRRTDAVILGNPVEDEAEGLARLDDTWAHWTPRERASQRLLLVRTEWADDGSMQDFDIVAEAGEAVA